MKTKKFIKEELTISQLSKVFGGTDDHDPCCTMTVFSDGGISDSDEDCEGQDGLGS